MAVPCSQKTPSLPAETSPETPRATRDVQGGFTFAFYNQGTFVLALQYNYRICRKTAPNCWFNNS